MHLAIVLALRSLVLGATTVAVIYSVKEGCVLILIDPLGELLRKARRKLKFVLLDLDTLIIDEDLGVDQVFNRLGRLHDLVL